MLRNTVVFIDCYQTFYIVFFTLLFLEWNSTRFGQFLCTSPGFFHCKHSKPVWHIPLLCVQWKTPDDGQRNCPKRVQFHSKNKFEKLVHLVGFLIRNLSRCTVTWTSNSADINYSYDLKVKRIELGRLNKKLKFFRIISIPSVNVIMTYVPHLQSIHHVSSTKAVLSLLK